MESSCMSLVEQLVSGLSLRADFLLRVADLTLRATEFFFFSASSCSFVLSCNQIVVSYSSS
jgi:hypothetical protein